MADSNKTAKDLTRKLIQQVQEIVERKSTSRDEKLQEIAELLFDAVDLFDWVGFYLIDPAARRELVLGPYVGEETEHTRIPFGTGICGQAADTEEAFVVQDVTNETNYLSCSMNVKAEIVLPIMNKDSFAAELDIDSHTKNGITKEHQEMLQEICDITATLF